MDEERGSHRIGGKEEVTGEWSKHIRLRFGKEVLLGLREGGG